MPASKIVTFLEIWVLLSVEDDDEKSQLSHKYNLAFTQHKQSQIIQTAQSRICNILWNIFELQNFRRSITNGFRSVKFTRTANCMIGWPNGYANHNEFSTPLPASLQCQESTEKPSVHLWFVYRCGDTTCLEIAGRPVSTKSYNQQSSILHSGPICFELASMGLTMQV